MSVGRKKNGQLKKGFKISKSGRVVKARKKKKYKSSGQTQKCAVKLGRRGGKATAKKRRSRKKGKQGKLF